MEGGILRATKYVKIATANVKDVHVRRGKRYVSIVSEFERLVERGVAIRILHGGPPSAPFRKSLAKRPALNGTELFEMLYCPRNHMKLVAVDGKFLYAGSANLTGAGLGVKNEHRRNHELGFLFTDRDLIAKLESVFDESWDAMWCETCAMQDWCDYE